MQFSIIKLLPDRIAIPPPRSLSPVEPHPVSKSALPDLIVRWAPSPCAETRSIQSPRFGAIAWPTPGKNPNGRSGNHTGEGFLFATGAGICPGSGLGAEAHILDLPPTILEILGVERPAYMTGDVLTEIALSDRHARRS